MSCGGVRSRAAFKAPDVATNYAELVALLRGERRRRNLSLAELDELAGFQDGCSLRLENADCSEPGAASHSSFNLWISALGVGLKIVQL
jgi:hypothetical protein